MSDFIGENFLLSSDVAKKLYKNYADMTKIPVVDYHCHISPKDIFEDKKFKNITELWLGGDHYKWRQLRTNGVEEEYITGNASDYDKFKKWAMALPKLIGNPLYIWSHMELQYYFGYNGNLNINTADEVWEITSKLLSQDEFSARGLIKKSNVKLICTTDDPVDDLIWHKKIREDESFEVQVLPAFRPDKAMNIEKQDFVSYISTLSNVSGIEISDIGSLFEALEKRLDYFEEMGCRITDHGLETIMYEESDINQANEILHKALNGERISRKEELIFKTQFMLFIGRECNRRNLVMQLHYGCKRDNNSLMYDKIGPDTGFDCINDDTSSARLANFLNALAKTDELPKTILYSLSPVDNAAIGTVMGCFQKGPVKGRIQQGSAWWFNDHYDGMRNQLKSFAQTSSLGNFVGMLTDSRSFVSYTRHDYFRRILCELVAQWVNKGEYPEDDVLLGELIKDISYNNAIRYFGFELKEV